MDPQQARSLAAARLTESGLRPTERRIQVLAELVRERDDATAHELHERLRGGGERIGLATVYRTLSALVDHGIVDMLAHRPGERCFRLCGEGHHHHLVCTRCHRVVEVEECAVDEWLERVAVQHGFQAVDHEVELRGLCGSCA